MDGRTVRVSYHDFMISIEKHRKLYGKKFDQE